MACDLQTRKSVAMWLVIWTTCVLLPLTSGQEMFTDPGFETAGTWSCYHTQCDLVTTKIEGKYALKVSNRSSPNSGPSQVINSVVPNGRYEASVYVKLLNDNPNVLSQHIALSVEFEFPSANPKKGRMYVPAAAKPIVTAADGWIHLQGDFSAPDKALYRTRLYISGPDTSVYFLVDGASLKPAPSAPKTWIADTNKVIDKVRKADINVRITMENGVDPNAVEIQIEQVKHSFPFGTAVRAKPYLTGDHRYRDFIHEHFNHAVLENDLKWQYNARTAETEFESRYFNMAAADRGDHIEILGLQMEMAIFSRFDDILAFRVLKGTETYDTAVEALKKLRENGLNVNGHCLVWSRSDKMPHWVTHLRGNALRNAVTHRIYETLNKTKGLIEHWDVNNEMLHTHWFRDILPDKDYAMDIYRTAHQADPTAKLFFNENTVTARGGDTMAYVDMVEQFKGAHVHVNGMGAQTHFRDYTAPDPYFLKKRLDILAKAGLPIWVSELDVYAPDVQKRADWYEIALRSLFGHPAVHGIIIWGFWSEQHYRGEPAALVSGTNLQMNAAGQRFFDLLETEWTTNVTKKISGGNTQFTVRGFHGDYEITATYNGNPLHAKKSFTLDASGTHAKLHITKPVGAIIG